MLKKNALILLIAISCLWPTTAAQQSGTISKSQILKYLRDGWTQVSGAVSQLKIPYVQESVQDAHDMAKLNFALFTYRYLKTSKDVDCTNYQTQCGIWNPERYNYKLLDKAVISDRAHESLKLLSCCVHHAKQSPEDKQKSPGFPYYQALNPHRLNEVVFDMAVSERMGEMAASLLQVSRVRLYQTAIFHKDKHAMNEETGWHQDLNMIPLDTGPAGYLSFWCPLSELRADLNDSMLVFAAGSHRDITLTHWYPSEVDYQQRQLIIADRYLSEQASVLHPGDCTVHSGWIYHKASIQPIHRQPRTAIVFGFVADSARVLPDLAGNVSRHFRPFTYEDQDSFSPWIGDLEPMTHIDHPMLPLVYDGIHGMHFNSDSNGADKKSRDKRRELAMGRLSLLNSQGQSKGGEHIEAIIEMGEDGVVKTPVFSQVNGGGGADDDGHDNLNQGDHSAINKQQSKVSKKRVKKKQKTVSL